MNTLVRAYLAYVRPLVEFNSIVWSPDTVKDIVALEGVQRRFTKKLPGLFRSCYQDRLRRLQLPSLELRRLYADLHCGSKNAPTLADYNYDPVQSILIIFNKLFANDHKSCLVVKFSTSPHICCHYTL